MNQASLLECVSLGAEYRKVLMLVVCFVLNETKLTSNGEFGCAYLVKWVAWGRPVCYNRGSLGALAAL